jgi:predicted TIM-barrel fold metal-dependent hydrolase
MTTMLSKKTDEMTRLADTTFCSDCCLSRRRILVDIGGLAALAGTALLVGREVWPQEPNAKQNRVDIHSHYAPPAWATVVGANKSKGLFGSANPLGFFKDWTPAKSIEQMDQAGVATSILSITTPGVWFGQKESTVNETRRLARDCNNYGAKMVADFPRRFGLFAVLPLPDVEGSLREIAYALDTLKADGFGLLSHYSETYGEKLLGDPAFMPVFEELNRRNAIVYVHRKISPEPYEIFGWDVHRTILSLLKSTGTGYGAESGGAPRYPNVRFIFSHAGGTMPFLVERSTEPANAGAVAGVEAENGMLNELRRFHYDTGHSNNIRTLSALKQIIPISQVLFGTDYPYARVPDEVKGLQECGVFNAGELQAIDHENALSLLPKYRSARP